MRPKVVTVVAEGLARRCALTVAVAMLCAAAASTPAVAAPRGRQAPGSVVVRRTAFGIPHVQASSFEGVGYGYGFAFAQDDVCTAAEDFVTVEGERSRFFGASGRYFVLGKEFPTNNLDSDLFWRQVAAAHTVQRLVAEAPPRGPEPEVLALARGYAAGYDRYLASVGGVDGRAGLALSW